MKLYKYVSSERIDILLNKKIRFSQAKVLNDPFELRPFYKDHTEKNIFLNFYKFSQMVHEYKKNRKIPNETEINELVKEKNRVTKYEIYDFLNTKIVNLSLSENKENLLMWAHYADNHSGFVIELDTESDFFKSNDKILFKIKYGIEKPFVTTNDFEEFSLKLYNYINKKEEVPAEFIEKISDLFKKGQDWENEKEWRLLSTVEKSINYNSIKQQVETTYIGSDYFDNNYISLFELPPNTISKIYVGERISKKTLRKLFLLLKHNISYSHIQLIQTKISDEQYKLDYSDVDKFGLFTYPELKCDILNISKFKRIINPHLGSYYKEIEDIKKI